MTPRPLLGWVVRRATPPTQSDSTLCLLHISASAAAIHNVVVQRRSARLAGKEADVFVDMTSRAVKLRALKDTLVSCSKTFRSVVSKHKVLAGSKASLDTNAMTALRKAAVIPTSPVPSRADV